MATYIAKAQIDLAGHLRYGTAVVEVEAETEEEAKIKIAEAYEDGNYAIIDVDYEIDDTDLDDNFTITKKEEN